jgi:hypothetical protein
LKAMAGYSGTPLVQKIGIKPGHRVILRNQPSSFLKGLGPLPEGVQQTEKLSGTANVVICFTDRKVELEKSFPLLAGKLVPDGMLWVSWPKRPQVCPLISPKMLCAKWGLNAGWWT